MAQSALVRPIEKHRLFVEATLAGATGLEASRAAGYTGSDKTLANTGRRLLQRADIQRALDKGREQNDRNSVLTRKQALQRLKHWADADDGHLSTKAIAQIAKMCGWDSPTQVEVSAVSITPEERRARVAALLGVQLALPPAGEK